LNKSKISLLFYNERNQKQKFLKFHFHKKKSQTVYGSPAMLFARALLKLRKREIKGIQKRNKEEIKKLNQKEKKSN